MIDKTYWEEAVLKLTTNEKANWAAHVLATNREILDEILLAVGREKVIANCLLCYSVDFTAQPYLDEILSGFSIKELISIYKKLDKKPLQTAGALMWLLEDIDPQFNWALSSP
ncbi:MAG: hypothetical protein JO149_05150 [Gammaproteobacteria bacterium]|nr:hypothetical protein [Gammaproteobacteria bacterium]